MLRRRAAWWSALIIALTWEICTWAFTWYLNSRLAKYEFVYGSLSAIVALLLWFFLISWLLLFGAYLTATIGKPGKTDPAGTG
ncbi:MAG TPA: YhjD/YihY/BrkB family envelope integrity protein [Anaerolineales bacterium]|nr:YhjD/YihY/BrkB family envelope integrity protein [Anaerolineales bacterium]